MSEEEKLRKQKEPRPPWYEARKRAEPPPASNTPAHETPLDLKTSRPHPKSQQSTKLYEHKRIRILEDKIIQNDPFRYVPPNVYIENNFYEPISPPDSHVATDNFEPNTTTENNSEATTTVQEEITEEQVEEYHVVTHDQYLEYMMLKRRFEITQDDSTECTQDNVTEPENENDVTQNNVSSSREKRIQELIVMSDEYKNFILRILNKVKTSDISRYITTISLLAKFCMMQRQESLELIQKMGEHQFIPTDATNLEQQEVNEETNPISINEPNEVNNPLLNLGNEWHGRMVDADVNTMNLQNVTYVSQAPQNEQDALQTKINHRYTVASGGEKQYLPHAYTQQQKLPSTFVPSAIRLPAPATQSDRQQVYSKMNEPNLPQPRWETPFIPANKNQTHIPTVIPSSHIQAGPEYEINPLTLLQQQRIPSPVPLLNDPQHIEQNIPVDRIRYPERIIPNNQQQTFLDPVDKNSQYPEPAVLNYQPQRYSETVIPNEQQQSFHESLVPDSREKYSERVIGRARQQRPSPEQQLISGQHQIYSDRVSQNIEQMRIPDPYGTKHLQSNTYTEQIEKQPQQQRYRGLAPSESSQQYPIPVIPSSTSQRPRYYGPGVLNAQSYRHEIPSTPYGSHAQPPAYLASSTANTRPKAQPKRQYQRRKDPPQRQHPASSRWQQIHSSQPVQPHPIEPYAVPVSQMIRRPMQPPRVPEVQSQTVHPISEQAPEYYPQFYKHPETPHVYRDQNYYNPYNNP